MGMMLILPIALIGVIWLMGRGEKKRRAEMEDKLKKGDRVVTRSGITGKVVEMAERTVRVEIAPGVNVTMVKSAIEGLDADAAAAPDKGKGAAAKDVKEEAVKKGK
jgi:preprotein translocase subunit YajC